MFPRLGPGLVGAAARTAVVAGTAAAVGTGVAHHQQEKYAREDAERAERQTGSGGQRLGAAAVEADYSAELKKLAELKAAGILTQDEFDAKKKQILGI
jgi:hypothetical protein